MKDIKDAGAVSSTDGGGVNPPICLKGQNLILWIERRACVLERLGENLGISSSNLDLNHPERYFGQVRMKNSLSGWS